MLSTKPVVHVAPCRRRDSHGHAREGVFEAAGFPYQASRIKVIGGHPSRGAISDAGVEAQSADGREPMGGIAGQEDTPDTIAFRDLGMHRP